MGSKPQPRTDRVGVRQHDVGDDVSVSYQPDREAPTEPKPERVTFDARVVSRQTGTVDTDAVVGLHVERADGTQYRIMRGGGISRFDRHREVSIGHTARVEERGEA